MSLMSFTVYRVTWVLKSPVKNQYFEKIAHTKRNFSGCPRKFHHRVMYIAPSKGNILFNLNFPFKLILRRFGLLSDV